MSGFHNKQGGTANALPGIRPGNQRRADAFLIGTDPKSKEGIP
jgi:hypothetical protein